MSNTKPAAVEQADLVLVNLVSRGMSVADAREFLAQQSPQPESPKKDDSSEELL